MATTIGRVRWLVIFWTFLVAAVSYLDRSNISIAAGAIQVDFGLTDIQLGTIFSAFALGYAVAQPFAGRLADRFGPRRVVFAGALWWSVLTVATALVPPGLGWSFMALLGVRFVLGLGEAAIFPSSNRLVSSWIPTDERGVANGIIFAGVGFGAGIAPPLITFITLASDWRWAFHASALIGLLVGVGWLMSVTDRPEHHARMTPAEAEHIRAGLPRQPVGEAAIARWRDIAGDRQVMLLAGSYFTFGYVAYIFFTWLFKYLSAVRGLDLKASAFFVMLPFIAMAVGSWLGGICSDRLVARHGKRVGRCIVPAISLALAAGFVALATQVDDARIAAIVLAGGAFALYFSTSSYWSLSADFGGDSAGSVAGFMNMCNQTGSVITASLTAVLASQFGWTASFLTAAAVCLAGAAMWLFIDVDHRVTARAGTKERLDDLVPVLD